MKLRILYIMHFANTPSNDYDTTVPDPEKFRIRNESFLVASLVDVKSQMLKLNLWK